MPDARAVGPTVSNDSGTLAAAAGPTAVPADDHHFPFGKRSLRIRGQRRRLQLSRHEFTNQKRDLGAVRLQGEVARVEEMDFRFRQIALERFGAGRQENRIVLAHTDSSGG